MSFGMSFNPPPFCFGPPKERFLAPDLMSRRHPNPIVCFIGLCFDSTLWLGQSTWAKQLTHDDDGHSPIKPNPSLSQKKIIHTLLPYWLNAKESIGKEQKHFKEWWAKWSQKAHVIFGHHLIYYFDKKTICPFWAIVCFSIAMVRPL